MSSGLDNLAMEMFSTFARFEYSLKAAKFHKGDGDAEANWRKFAESVPLIFDNPSEAEVREAVDYILSHPPKKQTIVNGLLTWSDSVSQTNLLSDRILIYVRRVRNNLFHGGKFNGHWLSRREVSYFSGTHW